MFHPLRLPPIPTTNIGYFFPVTKRHKHVLIIYFHEPFGGCIKLWRLTAERKRISNINVNFMGRDIKKVPFHSDRLLFFYLHAAGKIHNGNDFFPRSSRRLQFLAFMNDCVYSGMRDRSLSLPQLSQDISIHTYIKILNGHFHCCAACVG